ncbi:hypothetical protein GWI33_016081 [Rhynchophorus ferrugineus]|uniref:Uncharacterized protein n=1 Tax=Rhynchophorus ferrugineus TaxID=354439 RepID=A0A834HZE8_RHYFE|nr:hypothetical protein GWI33_016081 [Rhynchophorus ferrugineus]
MGNACRCMLKEPTPSHLDIIVDDSRGVTIKQIKTETSQIDKIRFILPVIKVTNDQNDVQLVFDPSEDPYAQNRLRASNQGPVPVIITPPSAGTSQVTSMTSSETGTPVVIRISEEADVHVTSPQILSEPAL